MMLWQPFHLKQCMTHKLPHHGTEHQWSVNDIWSCILGNQGITWMNQLITEQLTSFITNNTTYNRKNTDSKIINVADCETCKKRLLAVEYLILIIYNYPTAKPKTLYTPTDGPTGRPADNPPNSDRLGDFHQAGPELTVRVYWQHGLPICQRLGSDLDLDPMWRSGTAANPNYQVLLKRCRFVNLTWTTHYSMVFKTSWIPNANHQAVNSIKRIENCFVNSVCLFEVIV